MKTNMKKSKSKYPRITIRVDAALRERIEKLTAKSGMNISEVIVHCLTNQLPILERKHKSR